MVGGGGGGGEMGVGQSLTSESFVCHIYLEFHIVMTWNHCGRQPYLVPYGLRFRLSDTR